MALSDIIQKITDEANKKTAFMKQVADDEIKKIKEEGVQNSDLKKKEIEKRVTKKYDSIVEKAKILGNMEVKSNLLKGKREVINLAYSSVQEELLSLSDSDYSQLLASMMKKTAEVMPKGDLLVPQGKKKQTEDAIREAKADYHIKEESSSLKGGFILHSSKSEMNLSFSHLLGKIVRQDTELEVAKILFN